MYIFLYLLCFFILVWIIIFFVSDFILLMNFFLLRVLMSLLVNVKFDGGIFNLVVIEFKILFNVELLID